MNDEELQAHLRMVQAKNRVAITSQHLEDLPEKFKGGQYLLDNSKTGDGHRVFSNNVSQMQRITRSLENATHAPSKHKINHQSASIR